MVTETDLTIGMDKCGFNHLDRLDHTKGYTVENTVPICSAAKYAKDTSDSVSFLEQCMHIAYYRQRGELAFPESFGKPMKVKPLRAYINRDKKRGRVCTITKEKHEQLEQGKLNCVYTGLVATSWNRIDNTLPYSDENVQPVIGAVDIMRHDLTIDEFDQLITNVCKNAINTGFYEKLLSMNIPRCPEKRGIR